MKQRMRKRENEKPKQKKKNWTKKNAIFLSYDAFRRATISFLDITIFLWIFYHTQANNFIVYDTG